MQATAINSQAVNQDAHGPSSKTHVASAVQLSVCSAWSPRRAAGGLALKAGSADVASSAFRSRRPLIIRVTLCRDQQAVV